MEFYASVLLKLRIQKTSNHSVNFLMYRNILNKINKYADAFWSTKI